MTKTKFFLLNLFLLFSFALCAQQSDPEKARAESKRLMELYQKMEGTYQVQVIDSREKIGFPLSSLDSIQSKRHQTETVYLWLKPNVRIMVPSYADIKKTGFVPLPQTAYYSSNNLPGNK